MAEERVILEIEIDDGGQQSSGAQSPSSPSSTSSASFARSGNPIRDLVRAAKEKEKAEQPFFGALKERIETVRSQDAQFNKLLQEIAQQDRNDLKKRVPTLTQLLESGQRAIVQEQKTQEREGSSLYTDLVTSAKRVGKQQREERTQREKEGGGVWRGLLASARRVAREQRQERKETEREEARLFRNMVKDAEGLEKQERDDERFLDNLSGGSDGGGRGGRGGRDGRDGESGESGGGGGRRGGRRGGVRGIFDMMGQAALRQASMGRSPLMAGFAAARAGVTGIGSLLGGLGPVGVISGLAGFAGLGITGYAAYKGAMATINSANASIGTSAKYDPRVAGAVAFEERRNIAREMRRAGRLGGELESFSLAKTRFSDATSKMMDYVLAKVLPLMTRIVDMLASGLESFTKAMEILDKVYEILMEATGIGYVVKFFVAIWKYLPNIGLIIDWLHMKIGLDKDDDFDFLNDQDVMDFFNTNKGFQDLKMRFGV